jgi:16S rRNA G966 N2-methylase RsmD
MEKYKHIKNEHQLRSLVFDDYFKSKDVSWELEIEKIDFIITEKKSRKSKEGGADKHYLWAETKSSVTDDFDMLTQLILTIKKPYDKNEYIIPNYVGCFDTEKIIFVPTKLFLGIFKDSDVNWNIPPNDIKNEYFKKLKRKVIYELGQNKKEVKIFIFGVSDEEIKDFIKNNVIQGNTENKFEITDNNFDRVYLKWLEKVKPSLAVNWDEEKKNGLYDSHFFLADLLSIENFRIIEKLFIILQNDRYKLTKVMKKSNALITDDIYYFKDKQKAYFEFWSIYKRPPLPQFWENILLRQDLLVPQDIRERKGSFFTPQIWVELSQKYLGDVLGNNWQDKYYIWDCCAGTGNLLVGINRKIENAFASTIDEADVKVMYDRIENGAKLLKKNVFKFDFLNDDFKKLPKDLREIIEDSKKRKKLIVYINPPYAETGSKKKIKNTGEHKKGLFDNNKIYEESKLLIGSSARQYYNLFFYRIINEIKGCKLATFSTLNVFTGKNMEKMKIMWKGIYKKGFIVPANTFDNVKGDFPIGFHIWDFDDGKKFPNNLKFDIYDDKGHYIKKKTVKCNNEVINKWLKTIYDKENERIGSISIRASSIDKNSLTFITVEPYESDLEESHFAYITKNNLIDMCVYFTIRSVIINNWINNKDQYNVPNNVYKTDTEFLHNCFIYTMFDPKNNIKQKDGTNHWIPFTEKEVGIDKKFESHFMSDFIAGKIEIENVKKDEFQFDDNVNKRKGKMIFSTEAKDVYNAGLKLWKYYHSKSRININASLYDIRAYFQEFNNGKMNNKSNDEEYNTLIAGLREKMKILAKTIEPKIYEYGFLLE